MGSAIHRSALSELPSSNSSILATHRKSALDDDDDDTSYPPNAAKMKYIHSQQEMKVPEGGMSLSVSANLRCRSIKFGDCIASLRHGKKDH